MTPTERELLHLEFYSATLERIIRLATKAGQKATSR